MKPVMIGGPARLWDYSRQTTESLFSQTGNTGNLAFRYAIFKHLNRSARVVPWGASAETVQRSGDIAVVPCANQLGPHADCRGRAGLISQLQIPVVAVGLGAQSKSKDEFPEIPPDTVRWVQAMAARRPGKVANLTVRGEFTRRVLERMGIREEVEVLGCPSLFISDDARLGQTIAKRLAGGIRRIAVAAGNPVRPVSTSLEKSLFALAHQSRGSYIVQHPLPFIKAARGESDDLGKPWQVRLEKFLGCGRNENGRLILPSEMTVFFDVDAWMEELRRHDLVVGMRIHGIMLAIQAGVPALCITHDSRTEELCQTMGIPHVSAQVLADDRVSVAALLKHLEFDQEMFDQNRKQLAGKYRAVLAGAGLPVPKSLDHIAGVKNAGATDSGVQ